MIGKDKILNLLNSVIQKSKADLTEAVLEMDSGLEVADLIVAVADSEDSTTGQEKCTQ